MGAETKDLQIKLGITLEGVKESAAAVPTKRSPAPAVESGDAVHEGGAHDSGSRLNHKLAHIGKHQFKHVFKAVAYTEMTSLVEDILPNTDSNAAAALGKIGSSGFTGLMFGGPMGAIQGGILGILQALHSDFERFKEEFKSEKADLEEDRKLNERLYKVLQDTLDRLAESRQKELEEGVRKEYLALRSVL